MEESGEKTPLVIVCGPTATGKSSLAVQLALAVNGEVVSADSMQVYKGLDIATAKIEEGERKGIPHHMIDIVEPNRVFSVADYIILAKKQIYNIAAGGKIPIICGGTGLYIYSLIKGLDSAKGRSDIRKTIAGEFDAKGADRLIEEVRTIDPAAAKRLHSNDRKRVIRAVELLRAPEVADKKERTTGIGGDFAVLDVFIGYEDRHILHKKIAERVDNMMSKGLLEEAGYVYENKNDFHTAVQAIGYKEFFAYFDGSKELEDAVEQLKISTRKYAKRQVTWFRNKPAGERICGRTGFIDAGEINIRKITEEIKKHFKK